MRKWRGVPWSDAAAIKQKEERTPRKSPLIAQREAAWRQYEETMRTERQENRRIRR